MGFILLLLCTLMWSTVGIWVKMASVMVDSTTITFFRFFLGVVFLGLFIWWKDGKLTLRFDLRWIWLGALGKSVNYFFENMAISIGYSYGYILIGPIQTILLLVVSVFLFKENVSVRGWISAALCIVGVFFINWNGLPLSTFLESNALTTILFTCAAVGVVFHFLSQKILVQQMDPGTMNFSVFFWSSLIMLIPLPARFSWSGEIEPMAVLSLVVLGLITGVSFYLFALALKKVPFVVAVIVTNLGTLFTILWGKLFFDEPVTLYIVIGTIIFLTGIILLNLPQASPKKAADTAAG